LRLLERRGLLRFHRALEPVARWRFLIFPHHSAQIEETRDDGAGARFVVDSWFFDNGHPAAVLPLEAWLRGQDPNDDE
ncbi:MAG: hypothetical protein LBI62_05315, partial [Candidatus Accumulibacter sp.]|jgi:hypothetical protein|nr:hypothetical protein [Accumulibacter sp.]